MTLRAEPSPLQVFVGFRGDEDCGDGVLRMAGNRRCTAAFLPATAVTPPVPVLGQVSGGANGAPSDGDNLTPRVSGASVLVYVSTSSNMGNVCDGAGVTQIRFVDLDTGARGCLSTAGGASRPANGPNREPDISGDGRVVAWVTEAPDVLAGCGGPGAPQVVVLDRGTGARQCGSATADGAQGSGPSAGPRLSRDGRFLVFATRAANLVGGGDGSRFQILRVDRQTGERQVVSAVSGTLGDGDSVEPAISGDGDRGWRSGRARPIWRRPAGRRTRSTSGTRPRGR